MKNRLKLIAICPMFMVAAVGGRAQGPAFTCQVGLPLGMMMAARGAEALTTSKNAIPWNQIDAKADADYHGGGLSVTATESGARLHCVFQRMDGEATAEGLWLVSTLSHQPGDRFRVLATAVGAQALPARGTVTASGRMVRFTRAGLVEEYSVSIDGVRQDFLIEQPPGGSNSPASPSTDRSGDTARTRAPAPPRLLPNRGPDAPAGELVLTLAVTGATVQPAPYGAQLLLAKSGRKIAYGRLRATDATGKELPARIEAPPSSPMSLSVVVNDAGAVYPVRIDPTFSDANWISLGGVDGTDGQVLAEAMDSSGNLYIGGDFTTVGNISASDIAKWNGTNWSALGSGIGPNNASIASWVAALAVSGSNVYAGGVFSTAGNLTNVNYIAQWNGSSWSALGTGRNGGVTALALMGTNLYANGGTANGVAQWNGSEWSTLPGIDDVNALAVIGSNLYVGGDFTYAGPIQTTGVAQWNGSSWSALGPGLNGEVFALAVSGTNLYVGGEITMAGSLAVNNVALWNGSDWFALGSGINDLFSVRALAVSGSNLFAGGFAYNDYGVTNYVEAWNGTAWSSLGSGMGGIADNDALVYALLASGGTLYAGGVFSTAGGLGANNIAQWNGTNWSPLCLGIGGENPFVNAVAVADDTLYIGGEFITGGTNPASCVAQWTGSTWSGLGSGMADGTNENATTVNALAVMGSNLYAGGYFTSAGGVAVSSIAQWDGTNWSPLGTGVGGDYPYVNALAVSGTNLYAGGEFTTAGGNAANFIAQWNGNSWSSLGSGTYGEVLALAVSGDTLYAGGYFTSAGDDTNANYIAQWKGGSWSSLGSGLNSGVDALAVSGNTLYAGGEFTTAGSDTNASFVAQWNGNSWSSLGGAWAEGPYPYFPTVYALAVSGSTLYVGGYFTNAGGISANYIAQWNGSSWAPLGSGLNAIVFALAASGGSLYVGGAFRTAGADVSVSAAEANLGGSPPFTPLYIVTTNALFGFHNGPFEFTVSGPAGSNAAVLASTNLRTWIPLATNPLNLGSFNFTDSLATNYPARFYRAKLAQ